MQSRFNPSRAVGVRQNPSAGAASKPIELDAALLAQVGGGLALKAAWRSVDAPKGTWRTTEAPKGTW